MDLIFNINDQFFEAYPLSKTNMVYNKFVHDLLLLWSIWLIASVRPSNGYDVSTYMLENPDRYITKVEKILRAYSLDELLHILEVLIEDNSIIGTTEKTDFIKVSLT